MVFLRPILSLKYAVIIGPVATPNDKTPAIRDSCCAVNGSGSGLFSASTIPFSFGMMGEANANAIPAVNAIKLSVKKSCLKTTVQENGILKLTCTYSAV